MAIRSTKELKRRLAGTIFAPTCCAACDAHSAGSGNPCDVHGKPVENLKDYGQYEVPQRPEEEGQ